MPGAKYHKSPTEIVLRKISDSHYGMGDTTLITDKLETIKSFDAKEPTNTNSDRRSYGNNQYALSNIRKWLNSSGQGWYKGEHQYDAPPVAANVSYNPYDKEEGFLSSFPQEFVDMILTTSRQVLKPDVDGGGTISVQDKVFLLSRTEVGLGDEKSGQPEGKPIPYFNSNDRRIAYPTAYAVEQSEYKHDNLKPDKPRYYWLSSPYATYADNARNVINDGTINYYYAYHGNYGVRPALNLPSSALVSDTPNSDGHYEVMLNAAPEITLNEENGKILSEGMTLTLQGEAIDSDANDVVTVLARINNSATQTITAGVSDGKTPIPYNEVWTYRNGRIYRNNNKAVSDVLQEGNTHRLEVWAVDNHGNASPKQVRTFQNLANRPPKITIDFVSTPEHALDTDVISISGSAIDPDGDPNVKVFYQISGTGILNEVDVDASGKFKVAIPVGDLKDGTNTVNIIAEDSHKFRSQKSYRINRRFEGKELDKFVLRYELNPKEIAMSGIVVWIERSKDAELSTRVSLHKKDEPETFKSAELTVSVDLGGDLVEDEFELYVGEEDLTQATLEIKCKNGTISKVSGAFQAAKEAF